LTAVIDFISHFLPVWRFSDFNPWDVMMWDLRLFLL